MAHEKAISVMDKKYQAEDDARTMMRAMEITKDKDRYKACLLQLQKMKSSNEMAMSMMKEKHG